MNSPTVKNSSTQEPALTKPKSEFFSPQKRQAIREALDHLVVFEKYQNGKPEAVEKSGVCKACQVVTSHKCQKCNDYYCSNDCQHPYWKKHEAKCNKIPSSELNSPTSNKDTEPDEKLMISNSSTPFAKFTQHVNKTPVNGATSEASAKKWEPAMGKSLTKFRPHEEHRKWTQKRLSLSENESRSKERSSQRKRFLGKKDHNNTFPVGTSSSAETESVSNSVYSKISKPEAKTKELGTKTNGVKAETREAKKVVFFYKEPDKPVHWVMDESDVKEFELILNTLTKECDDYETIEPEVGLVCGCKYSDEWYRARVIELEPKCRVHYIDYGNSADAPSEPLKKLPPEIKMVKNLAYSIEFDERTPEKYKNKDLSGKTLKIYTKRMTTSGVGVVEIASDSSEIESTDSETTKNKTKKTPATNIRSAISLVESGSKGMISFLPGESKIRFGMIIPDGSEDETGIDVKESKALDLTELNHVRASEGDYVLVIDYDDQRRRGKVVSMLCSTYYVLLIDYGIVIAVENVYQLPERKANLVHLGAMVTITEIYSSEKVKSMGMSVYCVTGKQDLEGRWPCELKETFSQNVIAKGYIQSPPEEGVTVPLSMPLETGSICEMSIVTGVKSCYVRPLDEKAARKSLEMSVKMAEFLVQAKPLTQPPKIGKMYAAKNKKDDCFHRAVIRSKDNGKFKVLFVDHGTVEVVEMKDLKPLPVSIKVVPFFAAEVTLGRITVESLSDSAKQYLDMLISKNLTLVLSFSEGEDDEVVLREKKSGVIVNEVIDNPENGTNGKDEEGEKDDERFNDTEDEEDLEDVNVQDWQSDAIDKSPTSDESVVMKNELKLSTIILNVKYDLVLQYIEEKEFFSTLTFWMANMDDDTFSQVSNVVNTLIGKYCNEAKEPYRPKEQEMCLGLYEGDWYRALALSSENDDYKVFFVDFGNTCTLKPDGIRKMKRQFMEHPAWAFKCTISGMGKLIGKPDLKKTVYKELKRRMNTILKGVVVTRHEFEIYYVAIPEIEQMLC